MAIQVPHTDSPALEVADITPTGELESCNHLLEDHAALMCFYDEKGYILLRDILNRGSISRARDEMLTVAAGLGLVEQGDIEAKWTGKPFAGGMEESPDFAGLSQRLIEYPDNLAVLEKLLGEKACMVPIVQYRIYPPNGPITPVHQDGFYSPGIQDYKPLWVALTPCPRAVGGLMLAVGQNRRGILHDRSKSGFPMPRDAIPMESWATTDYMPGDLLIVHPYTPHASMPNTSDRLRITFDTRVQSAAHPSAFAATVKSVTSNSITVDADAQGELAFRVDDRSFIRVLDPGVREPFARFTECTKPGMRLIVVREGDYAVMLRKASEG